MDLLSKLSELAENIRKIENTLVDEETTKTACVMPFINALGYNIFNPNEVKPEYTADVPMKKGEKVDYAILQDKKPIILIEVKKFGCNLNVVPAAQLKRYFQQVNVKVGILTNGGTYRFYSDLEKDNLMDHRPFMEINIQNLNEQTVRRLMEFTKQYYDEGKVRATASELKYTREIKKLLSVQYDDPSEEFVKFVASQVYDGLKTRQIIGKFAPITKQAVRLFVSDKFREIQNRVDSDLEEMQTHAKKADEENEQVKDSGIVTTEEELQGFYMVKSLLAGKIDFDRITHRDTKSYFGVLLDDNNRKPICRLRFNNIDKKQIEIFIHDKETGEKTSFFKPIEKLDDIINYRNDIITVATSYDD